MSGRQSLLGQSLVRNANALNFGQDVTIERHWKRDWYSPIKPVQSTTITPSSTPTPFGDEATPQEQHYPFRVKAWVIDENYKPVVDGEEEDLLDLDNYSTLKNAVVNNGLTDQAIRGAVATDGDAIPGISKSTDYATAAAAADKKDEDEEEKEELKKEISVREETQQVEGTNENAEPEEEAKSEDLPPPPVTEEPEAESTIGEAPIDEAPVFEPEKKDVDGDVVID